MSLVGASAARRARGKTTTFGVPSPKQRHSRISTDVSGAVLDFSDDSY
jgi:hypothetical protein